MDHSEAKWNLCTLLFQFSSAVEDCQTKHWTEDLLKTLVLSGKRMGNFSSKLTKACAIWRPSYPTTRSAFSNSWIIRKRKQFALGVRPCHPMYLLQWRLSKDDGPDPHLSLFCVWEHHHFANLGALKILLNNALPEVNPWTYRGFTRVIEWRWRYRCGNATL